MNSEQELTDTQQAMTAWLTQPACQAHTGALIDVRYALRQLREFRCVERAIDALERVEEALSS